MSRFPVQGVFADGVGNIVKDGSVTVYEYNTAAPSVPVTLATVYDEQTGGSAISGSVITTDLNGGYIFWVDNNDYNAQSLFSIILSKLTHADVPSHVAIPGLLPDSLANRNLLINGDMSVAQQGTSFTSATTPANSDDTYMLDQLILLSDGNDIVDVTQQSGGGVSGKDNFLRLDIETASKKFGILKIIEAKDCKSILGGTASLSFETTVSNATKLSDIRAVVLSWDGTADTVTSDIVSAWAAEGTVVTPVANWTAENVAANLGVTTSWTKYKIEGVSIDTASAANVAVFIYQNNVATNDTTGVFFDITNVQLNKGTIATDFEYVDYGTNLHKCKRYHEILNKEALANYSFGMGQGITTATSARINIPYEVEKRVAPTVTDSAAGDFIVTKNDGSGQDVTVFTFAVPSVLSVVGVITTAAGMVAGDSTRLLDDGGGSARIKIDSRL